MADLPSQDLIKAALADGVEEETSKKDEGKGGESPETTPVKRKPPPTMFNEPDANSLLDSFGF